MSKHDRRPRGAHAQAHQQHLDQMSRTKPGAEAAQDARTERIELDDLQSLAMATVQETAQKLIAEAQPLEQRAKALRTEAADRMRSMAEAVFKQHGLDVPEAEDGEIKFDPPQQPKFLVWVRKEQAAVPAVPAAPPAAPPPAGEAGSPPVS